MGEGHSAVNEIAAQQTSRMLLSQRGRVAVSMKSTTGSKAQSEDECAAIVCYLPLASSLSTHLRCKPLMHLTAYEINVRVVSFALKHSQGGLTS